MHYFRWPLSYTAGERLRFELALPSMSGIQNLPYKPYTDNAAGKVNIIPFQGKEFARADAGTRINAE